MLPPKKRLLDQVRDRQRLKNYAYRTEKSYLNWIKQCILFHNKRHPNQKTIAATWVKTSSSARLSGAISIRPVGEDVRNL